MRLRNRLAVAAVFFAVLIAVGTLDALLTNHRFILPSPLQGQSTGTTSEGTVAKNNGASLDAIFKSQSITAMNTQEKSLLSRIIGSATAVHTQVLLKDNDRIALFSWIENPDTKEYFQAMKDSLRASFSPNVSDLSDRTDSPQDGPPRNILSFKDPAISDEKLVFLRIRQRLFEIHIANGKDDAVQALIDELSK